jgi:hypothetical protein
MNRGARSRHHQPSSPATGSEDGPHPAAFSLAQRDCADGYRLANDQGKPNFAIGQ